MTRCGAVRAALACLETPADADVRGLRVTSVQVVQVRPPADADVRTRRGGRAAPSLRYAALVVTMIACRPSRSVVANR